MDDAKRSEPTRREMLETLRADAETEAEMQADYIGQLVEQRRDVARTQRRKLRDMMADIDGKLADARATRDKALADYRRLNRALGLREDGTPRTPRGKQTVTDAADLPAGMISLGPDGLQITPDASPDREE